LVGQGIHPWCPRVRVAESHYRNHQNARHALSQVRFTAHTPALRPLLFFLRSPVS
jgi:hypothetical protein